MYTPTHRCRLCGSAHLTLIIDLGNQPLANAYTDAADTQPEPTYPLAVLLCNNCALVQLAGSIDPHELFDDYAYFSSYSTTMLEAMTKLAARTTAELQLDTESLVVELGSNDGYLLQHYRTLGIPVLGVEPAANVARVANDAGIPTIVRYFGRATAQEIIHSHGRADVIHTNNVLAHVPDIHDFVAGVTELIKDGGTWIVETPYVGDLIDSAEFDTIYHEHVFYYSATSLSRLATEHQLTLVDIEHLPIHGGSLRCHLTRANTQPSRAVTTLLDEEAHAHIDTPDYYARLAFGVEAMRTNLLALLHRLKADGATILGYGAAAKGTVLLNHFGIDGDLLTGVIDRNPHKQGRLVPGVRLPIVPPEILETSPPTHVLILAWNLAEEILGQLHPYTANGGTVIVPGEAPELVTR